MITLTTIINVLGISVLSRINNVGVAAELVGASGLVILFLIHANRSPSDVLTTTANTANVPVNHAWGYLGALLVGAIMPLYVMYGFDSAGSLAEETDEPRKRAPRAIIQALATAGTMGFLLILFGTMAVSDKLFPAGLGAGGLALITKDVLGSFWGDVFLWDCALAIFVCCLAIHAMSVRILFAMARDNNLPGGRQAGVGVGHPPRAGGSGGAGGRHRDRHPGAQHRQPVCRHDRAGPGHHLHVHGLPGRHHPALPAAARGLAEEPPHRPIRACSSWEAGRW